jgi:streptogramin lyase
MSWNILDRRDLKSVHEFPAEIAQLLQFLTLRFRSEVFGKCRIYRLKVAGKFAGRQKNGDVLFSMASLGTMGTRDRKSAIVKKVHRSWVYGSQWWLCEAVQSLGKRPRPSRRPDIETLESRRLLTATIAEFPALFLGTNGKPTEIAFGSDNNLYFTEPVGGPGSFAAGQIGVFNPMTNSVSKQISTTSTGTNPLGIVATSGADDEIWFTASSNYQAGEIATDSQSLISSYNHPYSSPLSQYNAGAGITSLDGSLWFTVPGANGIAEVAAVTHSLSVYSLSPANINVTGFSSQIIADPANNLLYFTEPGAIGIFSPTTGTVTGQVSLPTGVGTQMPSAITVGPDGNVWFTESDGTSASVGVIDTTTQTYINEFSLPTSSQPEGITAGPDGNVWFTETGSGAIGMIEVASLTNPVLDTLGPAISIPVEGQAGGVVASPQPVGITTGPDNNLWFADSSGAIGVVTLNNSAAFTVTSAPAMTVTAGASIGLAVTAEYSSSDIDSGFEGSVTATVYDSADEVVGTAATVTAVDGVATFAGLAVDLAGTGYTIKVTSSADNAPSSLTTSSFSVVAASPSKLVLSALPGTVTAGSGFGLTVELEDQFNNVATNYTGTVNVALANNPGGSVLGGTTSVIVSPGSATPGYASFTNLTLTKAAAGYTLKVLATGVPAQTTGGISVASSSASQLVVTSPPASALTPGAAFALTVAVEDRYGNLARTYNGTVSVALASNPGGGSLSGTTSEGVSSSGSAPGYATFSGLSLANPGNGYTLLISATGLASTTYGTINVLAPPPPTPPSITSVSVIFTQKTNKKGKKIGKPVISGYVITFSTAMNQGSLVSTGSYVVDTVVTTKRTRKKPAQTILTPIGFSVKAVTDNSVTLSPSGTPFAKKAGLITVIAAGSGVESSAGATLASSAVFSIAKGGKSI